MAQAGPLGGTCVVLGVSGGIAAYKAVEVCRRLVDAGAHVVPVMTKGAEHFVGRTTFSALASEPVQTDLWDAPNPIPHTRLGQRADLVLVVPATARVLAAYAAGLSTDLLTNVLLATRAPVVVCPAMHTEMWEHAAVVDNVATLRRRGVHIVEPATGRLAGGDVGAGRLADPVTIVAAVERVLAGRARSLDLAGADVVVSAGGTREPIDAVRVIANRSSGKQGYAVAGEAAARGARVTIVSTVQLPVPPGVDAVIEVETAAEMHDAMRRCAASADVVVMAAAVADFRPVVRADGKLKKRDGVPEIALEPTADILADLGARKRAGQVLVGFAAETDDLVANAEDKLRSKGADLIVANDVSAEGVGFQHDTNAVTLLRPAAEPRVVDLTDKRTIAVEVVDEIVAIRATRAADGKPLDTD
jgi:phosphopantothenoylcysteine decarboxylase / phosphopantothenate---cysteine ligase